MGIAKRLQSAATLRVVEAWGKLSRVKAFVNTKLEYSLKALKTVKSSISPGRGGAAVPRPVVIQFFDGYQCCLAVKNATFE